MALDPLTVAGLGGFLGSASAGFLKTIVSGTKLDPRVANSINELSEGLTTVAKALKSLLVANGHHLQPQELEVKLEGLTGRREDDR